MHCKSTASGHASQKGWNTAGDRRCCGGLATPSVIVCKKTALPSDITSSQLVDISTTNWPNFCTISEDFNTRSHDRNGVCRPQDSLNQKAESLWMGRHTLIPFLTGLVRSALLIVLPYSRRLFDIVLPRCNRRLVSSRHIWEAVAGQFRSWFICYQHWFNWYKLEQYHYWADLWMWESTSLWLVFW